MRQLMFDEVGTDLENFIKDRPRHCPESVAGHLVLAVPHAAQRGVDRVFVRTTENRKSPFYQGAYALNRTILDFEMVVPTGIEPVSPA